MSAKRVRRIEIPEDVAGSEEVPEDLDSEVYGPYAVPEPARRRSAGMVYAAGAVVLGAGALGGALPSRMVIVAVLLATMALYHVATAWRLDVREHEALEVANRVTEFPVGHASASINFEGWLAKPVWNVLVFSADDPPSHRGLVRVDALTGSVIETYTEPIEI